MSDPAIKKRQARAKAHARKTLEENGYLVFDVSGVNHLVTFIAVEPDNPKARFVRVCLEVSKKKENPIKGIRLEYWNRQLGKKGFEVTKS